MAGKGRQQKLFSSQAFTAPRPKTAVAAEQFKPFPSGGAAMNEMKRLRWALGPTQTLTVLRGLQDRSHSAHFQETVKVYSLYWDRQPPHVSEEGGRGNKRRLTRDDRSNWGRLPSVSWRCTDTNKVNT